MGNVQIMYVVRTYKCGCMYNKVIPGFPTYSFVDDELILIS